MVGIFFGAALRDWTGGITTYLTQADRHNIVKGNPTLTVSSSELVACG